jgi:predicted protein tyrosine phosphatase
MRKPVDFNDARKRHARGSRNEEEANTVKNNCTDCVNEGASLKTTKLLFADTLAVNRAPTAAALCAADERFEARAAGTSQAYALHPVTASDIAWADGVVVMEAVHAARIREGFGDVLGEKPLICLHVQDRWSCMSAPLMERLITAVSRSAREDWPGGADKPGLRPPGGALVYMRGHSVPLPGEDPCKRYRTEGTRLRPLCEEEVRSLSYRTAEEKSALLLCPTDDRIEAGKSPDLAGARLLYEKHWEGFNGRRWADWFEDCDRLDYGKPPYIPNADEAERMLNAAVMLSEALCRNSDKDVRFGTWLWEDARLLVAYACPTSASAVLRLLRLSTDSFRVAAGSDDKHLLCGDCLGLGFFRGVARLIRDDFLRDADFKETAVRFLETLLATHRARKYEKTFSYAPEAVNILCAAIAGNPLRVFS